MLHAAAGATQGSTEAGRALQLLGCDAHNAIGNVALPVAVVAPAAYCAVRGGGAIVPGTSVDVLEAICGGLRGG